MTYRERKELEQQIKKEQIKEWVLFTFIVTFILMLTFYILNNQYNKAVDKCSQKHDIEYCIRKLR